MTPAEIQRAAELVGQGNSLRTVGKMMGVSRETVRRALRDVHVEPLVPIGHTPREASPEPEASPSPSAPASAPAASPPEAPPDPLIVIQRAIRDTEEARAAAIAVGDHQTAQRYSRTLAMLAPVLARTQRTVQEDADVLRISRRDLEEARALYLDRVRRLLDRPFLCAHCNRVLSVQWGMPDGEGG